jgi:hypothetical protein
MILAIIREDRSMAAGVGDKGTKDGQARPPGVARPITADQGRGDMVSENRAANERFQRNSKMLQQEQSARNEARPTQPQAGAKELAFAPDRQAGPNFNQLKQEHAQAVTQGQGAKKELSFGADRQQGLNSAQLGKNQGEKSQGQGAKKELSFGADRQSRNYGQLKQEQSKLSFGQGRDGAGGGKEGPGHGR